MVLGKVIFFGDKFFFGTKNLEKEEEDENEKPKLFTIKQIDRRKRR